MAQETGAPAAGRRAESGGFEAAALRRVRLVASDMDGTLLDEDSLLPSETFALIRDLRKRGVRFAAASGRRFDTLRDFFSPVGEFVDFVASNGAQVVADGELVGREVFSHLALTRLAQVTARFDTMHLGAVRQHSELSAGAGGELRPRDRQGPAGAAGGGRHAGARG